MTSSGNSGLPMCRSAALTECTRSRRESISVPSRSKITSVMECGSKARRVRIICFQNKTPGSPPSARSGIRARNGLCGDRRPRLSVERSFTVYDGAPLQTEVHECHALDPDWVPPAHIGFITPFADGLNRSIVQQLRRALDDFH